MCSRRLYLRGQTLRQHTAGPRASTKFLHRPARSLRRTISLLSMFPAVAGVQPETSRSIKPRERDLGDLRLFFLVRILTRPTNHPRHAACASNYESKPVRPLIFRDEKHTRSEDGRKQTSGVGQKKWLARRMRWPHELRMPELKAFASSVAIVVSSCDAFFDAWRPFVFFFRKYWSDCPFPVYLIVNRLRVRSNFIQPISVGPDRDWASNMNTALASISQPYILYFQEDYFLNGAVKSDQLAQDFAYAFENDAASFCFYPRSQLEPHFTPLNDRFGI